METKQDLFNEWCKLAVAEVYNKDLAIFDWEDAMFKVYAKATTFALLHKLDLPYVITDNYEIPSSAYVPITPKECRPALTQGVSSPP